MNRKIILCTLLFGSFAINAQIKDGGINQQMMQKIESTTNQSSFKAIANAMASNPIDDLARNANNKTIFDDYFSI